VNSRSKRRFRTRFFIYLSSSEGRCHVGEEGGEGGSPRRYISLIFKGREKVSQRDRYYPSSTIRSKKKGEDGLTLSLEKGGGSQLSGGPPFLERRRVFYREEPDSETDSPRSTEKRKTSHIPLSSSANEEGGLKLHI